MKWALSELPGYQVHTRDGRLGTVTDLYFDDVYWSVRYLAVTGPEKSLPRTFLLPPEMISRIDREIGWLSSWLPTATIHNSPVFTAARGLSCQDEKLLRAYYELPNYWSGPPGLEQGGEPSCSLRLHSQQDALDCHLLAGEEDLGCLRDLMSDDHTWKIHSVEVDASQWPLSAGRAWLRLDNLGPLRVAGKSTGLPPRPAWRGQVPAALHVAGGEACHAGRSPPDRVGERVWRSCGQENRLLLAGLG